MKLIEFMNPIGERCLGFSAGRCVADVQYNGKQWVIERCIGLAEKPKFDSLSMAQDACNAYMAKFLLDLGFVPGAMRANQ